MGDIALAASRRAVADRPLEDVKDATDMVSVLRTRRRLGLSLRYGKHLLGFVKIQYIAVIQKPVGLPFR
ncbi:hypothetical protein GCM10007868_17420 [Gluconobacter frateurii]|uniref:Uncharacterized protein n=1 Tax=Gluconobacter frateurii NRIC 0228 TaxID=1307946 RepID=A0ABQ0QF77_9PROT|nr:hypothetical protein AA0228_2869 [Gluconobacter frateurii NRIC 0228]GLP90667.1 hypothetical protein GCM10007868_17420 [Gluconobacter frateurii]